MRSITKARMEELALGAKTFVEKERKAKECPTNQIMI